MANIKQIVFNSFLLDLANAGAELDNIDLRLAIIGVSSSLTEPTTSDYDASNTSGFTTPGEWSAAGYTSGGAALANEALSEVNSALKTGYVKLDSDDPATWTITGAPNEDIAGFLLIEFVINFSGSKPIAAYPWPGSASDQPGNGDTLDVVLHSQGLLKVVTTRG